MFKVTKAALPSHRTIKSFKECSEKTKRIEALKGSISEEDTELFKNLRTLDQKTAIRIVKKGVSSESRPKIEVQEAEVGTSQATNSMLFTDDETLAFQLFKSFKRELSTDKSIKD